ncbi:ferredoxin-NADP reductase [Rhodococcus erythropolis]|uniref:PDR/VanB family oxidoreductase n=1 Tax=Rhodococcus erythropolis TaxID=1833 RepID=UPI002167D371|nr:PDR/VanB family oxidoreductase [Rhodococcus erythropolis]MCS4255726.1 ferredoxin-NADP reductase [Rhodococcus erythropolis]MCW2425240.1 ferredoxin-NADP reductase [Rhodococcus erythropolis]
MPAISGHPESERILTLIQKTEAADSIVVLELRDPAGDDLPAWTPGAHIDLQLEPGLVRQYSLCGDPVQRDVWQIAVLREPAGRGGSQYVHDKLEVGASVTVRGPRNHFELKPSPKYLFIAGGIGITPIMTMAAAAEEAGAEWKLVYGGRNHDSMAFAQHLAERFGEKVELHPQDIAGLIDLPSLLAEPQPDTLVYCCGPAPLLDAVTAHCNQSGSGYLHLERFLAQEFGEPVVAGNFDVELAQTGTTVTVTPDKSILQAVTEAGAQVLSSCEVGTCGTCETAVLAGEVDHRDSLLTRDEQDANDTMMICVSRAACAKLVLDL